MNKSKKTRVVLPHLRPTRVKIRPFLYAAVPMFLVLGLAAWISIPLAGALYAVLFTIMAFVNPAYALIICFASASFVTDIQLAGFQLSFGEISLALMFPVTLFRISYDRRGPDMNMLAAPATLYVLVCVVATILHWENSAISAMLQMLIYLFVAVIVFSSTLSNPLDLFPSLQIAVIVGVFMAGAALVTNYQFLNLHKNAWGAIMSTLMVIAVELWFAATKRQLKWTFMIAIGAIGVTLLFTLSRGAWLGTLAGLFALFLLRRQFRLAFRLSTILVPLIAVCWFLMPSETKDYATGFDPSEHGNIAGRLTIIEYCYDTFCDNPILGVGISLRKQIDATNIFMITLAETGIVGLICFLLVHVTVFRMIWKNQKSLPLSNPLFSILAIAAGLIVRCLAHGLVDHYWSRGPILQAWGAVGMAICVVRALRQRRPSLQPRLSDSTEFAGWDHESHPAGESV